MDLVSLQFILFLAALLALYYTIGSRVPKYQWVLLLVGSLAFVCFAGGVSAVVFLVLTALLTWAGALVQDRIETAGKAARKEAVGRDAKRAVKAAYVRRKRVALVVTLVLGLGELFYFKYWNVFLYYLRLERGYDTLGILLPLGLSFYLFQSLSYLIDCYNAKYPPERNFLRYLLFVSYFPQILQGPINRFDQLAHQLTEPHAPDLYRMRRALLRAGLGFVKKAAIANVLFDSIAGIFDRASSPFISGTLVLWGLLLYSLQMYADFSGGIDLVEGVSELFGITMAPNFRQPYFSTSLAEFWRRWHMSLGAWMRDYVFYPLAITKPFKRLGKWAGAHFGRHAGRTIPACVANVIVFLFVGLWHGAEGHYIVWGLYNGLVVALSDLLSPVFDKLAALTHVDRSSAPYRVFAMARTFAIVCVGRIFDCFDHIDVCVYSIRNILTGAYALPLVEALTKAEVPWAESWGVPVETRLVLLLILIIDVAYERGVDVRTWILGLRPPVRAALIAGICVITMASVGYDTTNGGGEFLYANF